MRFICCDLENTSLEDDVDPRHFITVRQPPLAADPQLALQSLLSLFLMCAHAFQRPFAWRCASARSLSNSIRIPWTQVHFSFTHAHAEQREMDFNEKQIVWLLKSQWEMCQQPAINFVGSLLFDGLKCFVTRSQETTEWHAIVFTCAHTQQPKCTQTCSVPTCSTHTL